MTQISKKNRKNYKTNKTKGNKKSLVLKGGARHTLQQLFPSGQGGPNWRSNFSTLVRVTGLNLYGTSLPIWNQRDMENIFRFYLFRKDINRVISLHACATPDGAAAHPSCNAPNNHLENTVFNQQKDMSPITRTDPTVQFIDIFIRDMRPGTILAWAQLSNYRFSNPDEKSVIHCYAGFGRTGSALLFFILYYKTNIFDIVLNPYFNQINSAGMYDYIRTLMMQNIEVDNDPVENNPYNGKIMAFNRSNVVNETMNITNLFHANLLISRINYCILLFAHNHGISIGSPMYLYRLLPIGTTPARQNIFQPVIGLYNPTQLSNPAVLNNVFIAP